MSAPELLADRLQLLIESDRIVKLPSRRKLAEHFGVSEMTVARAASLLRSRGVLEFAQGQSMRVANAIPAGLPANSDTPVYRLYTKLKDMIGRAEPRVGSSLPKIERFVIEDRVTNRTVARAYGLLVENGLAYRKGKAWIVGQPVKPPHAGHSGDAPVMLIVGNRPNAWGSLWTRRTERFAFTFLSEVERFGVRICFVFTHPGDTGVRISPMDRGQVASLVRRLGSRYLGTLIASSWAEMREMPQWIDFLCRQRKPVVWIDRIDEKSEIDPRPHNFTRCFFSESAAVQLACRYLAHHGHRKIGYLMRGGAAWVVNRFALIEREFDKLGEGFDVTASPGNMTIDEAVEFLVRRTGTRALIAPNDNAASSVYEALQTRDLGIPARISVISFDNFPEYSALPITTVDFGFGHLGYCAFHTIFGDIPVTRDKRGFIQSKPHIAERGSVLLLRR